MLSSEQGLSARERTEKIAQALEIDWASLDRLARRSMQRDVLALGYDAMFEGAKVTQRQIEAGNPIRNPWAYTRQVASRESVLATHYYLLSRWLELSLRHLIDATLSGRISKEWYKRPELAVGARRYQDLSTNDRYRHIDWTFARYASGFEWLSELSLGILLEICKYQCALGPGLSFSLNGKPTTFGNVEERFTCAKDVRDVIAHNRPLTPNLIANSDALLSALQALDVPTSALLRSFEEERRELAKSDELRERPLGTE